MLSSLFEGVQIGEPQIHGSVTVFPLLARSDWGPAYHSLGEAMEAGTLKVAEVGASGSVPELSVENLGALPVLILDGEELAGAKQNRVLNTTVLVAAGRSMVIPVSCTEHGRWHHISACFRESSHLMARRVRCAKNLSVSDSLRRERSHRSDQGKVWADIDGLFEAAEERSQTGAMSDLYEARGPALEPYLEAFRPLPGQRGLLVFLGGLPAGLDLVSSERAYGRAHSKLVRSYCLEDSLRPARRASKPAPSDAEAFLRRAASSPGAAFPSPGLGTDHRYGSDGLVGSALEVDGSVLHAAFFLSEEPRPRGGEEPEARPRRAPRVRDGAA